MRLCTVVFLVCVGLDGSLFAQTPDPFQPDIPAPLVAMVDDANKKVQSGDYAAAAAELSVVLKQRRDYYRALFNIGLIYQYQGKYDQALPVLKLALELRDKLHISDSSVLNSIGWVYMNMGDYEYAEQYFLRAFREGYESPSDTERALNNLGYLYLQKGDTAKARVYLQKAIDDYHSTGAQKVLKMTEQYDEREKADQQKISRLALVEDNRVARIFVFAVDQGQKEKVLAAIGAIEAKATFAKVINVLVNKGSRDKDVQVRYFRDTDGEEAAKILTALKETILVANVPARISRVNDPDSVGTGRKFQVWLISDALR